MVSNLVRRRSFLLGLFVVAWLGVVVWMTLTVRNTWREFHDRSLQTSLAIARLDEALGFEGLIHDFKNLVLRRDPGKVDEVREDCALARDALTDLEALLTERDRSDLTIVTSTVDLYCENADRALRAIDAGESTEEIDLQVKIDDRGAKRALASLRSSVRDEVRALNEVLDREIDALLVTLALSALLLPLLALNSRARTRSERELLAGAARETEQRKAIERLAEERQVALVRERRHTELLEQFGMMTAHDLRTPVRGIQQVVEWLASADLDSESIELLELLTARADRLDAMIDGLEQFVGAARDAEAPRLLRVATLAREAWGDIPSSIATLEVVGDAEATVPAERLRALLRCFFSNAIAHRHRATVTVRATVSQNEGGIRIDVSDDGPGIDPRFYERVFEPFETLSTKDDASRAGMGLAIARRFGHALNAEVAAVGSGLNGRGVTFSVTLHRHPSDRPRLPDQEE